MSAAAERLLALDPGNACGWAHSSGTSGCWQLKPRQSEHNGQRLVRLYEHLTEVEATLGISKIVYEASHHNPRGLAAVAVHGQLVGTILLFAAERAIPYRDVPPMTIKAFAGHGGYDKHDMLRALASKLGIRAYDQNQADALWLLQYALCGFPELERQGRSRKRRRRGSAQERPRELF